MGMNGNMETGMKANQIVTSEHQLPTVATFVLVFVSGTPKGWYP